MQVKLEGKEKLVIYSKKQYGEISPCCILGIIGT
jgi:hypothetical protein